jgi:manganese transport protein
MEGYLRLRISPMIRRLITRLLAIIPTVLVLLITGESEVDQLLIFSQVLLSMQLAFAVIPLIHFVSDKRKMGSFAIGTKTKVGAWIVATLIVVLNMKLFLESAGGWMAHTENVWVKAVIALFIAGVFVLLAITLIYPLVQQHRAANISVHENIMGMHEIEAKPFRKIALALDYSNKDQQVIRYAMQLGGRVAEYVLIHIVESVSARVMGPEARDYETRKDKDHLEEYVQMLAEKGYKSEGVLGFKNRAQEIARIIHEEQCDLLIIGSHGHKAAKDIIFGETINTVRHMIDIPVFIAK